MTKLSDTQGILLSGAAQRADGSVLPLPASITPGGGATKAITALLRRSLAEERETSDLAAVYRQDGDLRYGVFITAAGASAIGIEQVEVADTDPAPAAAPVPAAVTAAKPASKASRVLDLLTRPEGATLADLIALTGWLPHTTRAALTGIRKKGHAVERIKRDGVTCYRIAAAV